uniref:3'-5' exonuclease domain-containing protein n=1 Tax=Oryza meridionalis TaxID=40149 RepID=A0A0E0C7L8_9ORYZ
MATSIVNDFGDGTYTVAFDEDKIYMTVTDSGEEIIHADYVPDQLGNFLGDGRFTFVGVGIHDDVDKLREHYDLEVENAVDLRYLAAQTIGKPALRSTGLQGLVWEVMGVWMEKPHHVRVSAWDSRQLTLDQMMYACADAFASFEVGRSLYDDYE